MESEKIVDFLKWTGHWQYPNGIEQAVVTGPFNQALKTIEGQKAVASFQAFEANLLDRLCLKIHGRPAQFDGDIGPATIAAMQVERCGHADYGPNIQAAVGNGGSWAKCHNVGDFHCASVKVNKSGMPSFLEPVFDKVWSRVASAYNDIGLKYFLTEEDNANINIYFVSRSSGWIGLSQVGQQESCSSSMWTKFLSTYQPSNIVNEWTTLFLHELCHSAGLFHTRGGIMNPSIVVGLAPTWAGDPSESLLKKYYGGKSVEQPNPPPTASKKYWTHIGYKDNEGGTIWTPLAIPIPVK